MAVSKKLTNGVSNAKSILRHVNGVLRNENIKVEECIKLIKNCAKISGLSKYLFVCCVFVGCEKWLTNAISLFYCDMSVYCMVTNRLKIKIRIPCMRSLQLFYTF